MNYQECGTKVRKYKSIPGDKVYESHIDLIRLKKSR